MRYMRMTRRAARMFARSSISMRAIFRLATPLTVGKRRALTLRP